MDESASSPQSAAPARRGTLIALSAAVLFGASTPLVQRFGSGVGSFATASLLYAGAALAGALTQRTPHEEARLRWRDVPRLGIIALVGAVAAPVALAWGLQRTSAISASLLLNFEAVFTALLARVCYGESMDRRVLLGLALITLGALALVAGEATAGTIRLAGILAVGFATAAWALDNVLSRALAERDPGQVVLAKCTLGAAVTAVLAAAHGESLPGMMAAVALPGVGVIGYGLSLRLYLLAQRSVGAGRTGSVFAFAPFAGALVAVALGERDGSVWMAAGALMTVAGLVLHLTERHAHPHHHDALEHEHAHTHDDGHHDHAHGALPAGPHSHWHRHTPQTHSHPHVPDAHHGHSHRP